jgi:hypothetical protein
MFFVIAGGIVSLAVSIFIGVLLIRLSHFVLGGTVSAILFALLFAWWLRRWWREETARLDEQATRNGIEYLEELAEEHRRGTRDQLKKLKLLLPRFENDKRNKDNLWRYEERLDNIRRMVDFDDQLSKKLSKVQPELDRQIQLELDRRCAGQKPSQRQIIP